MSESATPDNDAVLLGSPSVELSSNRTSLSFERTRMSTDRTLMASVRTSLSLISFGFTINEVVQRLQEQPGALANGGDGHYLGLLLVLLGIALLTMGIFGHRKFMRSLAARKERLYTLGLVRRTDQYEPTPTFITAIVLLLIGLFAAGSIIWRSFL